MDMIKRNNDKPLPKECVICNKKIPEDRKYLCSDKCLRKWKKKIDKDDSSN